MAAAPLGARTPCGREAQAPSVPWHRVLQGHGWKAPADQSDRYVYRAFGAGPRNRVGEAFAVPTWAPSPHRSHCARRWLLGAGRLIDRLFDMPGLPWGYEDRAGCPPGSAAGCGARLVAGAESPAVCRVLLDRRGWCDAMTEPVGRVASVRLLYVPDCPLADQVRRTLAECLPSARRPVRVEECEGDYPSPTLLIDGVDVVTGAPPRKEICCRLDLPTSDGIMTALNASNRYPN